MKIAQVLRILYVVHDRPSLLAFASVILLLLGASRISSFSQNTNSTELLSTIKDKKTSDTTRAMALTEVAYQYWTTKSDSTNLLAHQAVQLSNRLQFTKGLARAHCVLGIYYYNLGNSIKALAYYDSALTSATAISDGLALGRIYNGLGGIFVNFGDYEKALTYHFLSLKTKEKQGDIEGIGNSYNNIGNIYFKLGNYEKALSYCLESLNFRKDNEQGVAASKNNIALIYDKLGDQTKSLAYFLDALSSFKSAGNQRGITYSCHDIAQVFMNQKKYDKALAFLTEGLQTAEMMKSQERISDFKVSFAHYYNAIGNYAEVIKNAQEALRLADESGLLNYSRAAYQEMAMAAFQMGQFKQAYLFQSRFSELTDSIQNEKKIEKALQEEFNFKESKSKLEQEKKELMYANTNIKQQWLLYTTLGALAGVIAIAVAFYKSSRMKRRTGEMLAFQKNELANMNALILEQNRLLLEGKSQLEQKIEERTHDLKISNQELVNQNLVMEQFSFMTAHNLRGPVARLMGLSSLFNFSDLSEPFNEEVMKRMQQSSADLDEVIHDITSILRVKSGVQDPIVSLNLKETIDKILYQFRESIAEKNIVVKNELDAQVVISGILAYVQSVFYNVISNSIKYSDNTRAAEIKIAGIKSEGSIRVTISDNGIGFAADQHREKLFRPFTRFSTVREGKGLGLYLIKIQMESMRGLVQIESDLNVGTLVILTFAL